MEILAKNKKKIEEIKLKNISLCGSAGAQKIKTKNNNIENTNKISNYNCNNENNSENEKMDLESFLNAKCHNCVHKIGFFVLDGCGYFKTKNCNLSINQIVPINLFKNRNSQIKCNFIAI
ncbi:MAG: hypothetical protein ACTSRZ_01615 [Promethearchaeota archaeon]